MADTTNLMLPLLSAAQAQKHVSVNEALARLDGLVQLRLLSRTVSSPPVASEGSTYAVPTGGSADWLGHDGEIAIWSNGGWVFTTPAIGWQAYIVDEGTPAMYDGTDWVGGALAATAGGAVSRFEAIELSHTVGAGATSSTSAVIPANSLVFGVTGRVTDVITGSATSFELGVPGASNRYGSGLGLGIGSYVMGLSGSPVAYYADTPLELTASGGAFNGGGTIVLVVHAFRMTAPI